ncbi:MAG: 1-deoxy-D-xylulose-5-phosphate reductoisomerase [Clostridiales bacterium]|jgi:1-deoxy-D-xylulose-5-phosphate reductoisomerase|nr:1-deoxy-D-xylulose-5-phosphate reductoisomerase [Clostridiales bacterium]
MEKNLSILGSTGSIGCQALEVARNLGLTVSGLAAHNNIGLLETQIREFRPQAVAVFDVHAAKELKLSVSDLPVKVLAGIDGLCEIASLPQADLILNSVVGMVGLKPTLAAIQAKKNIALANKETLVAGGALVMEAAKRQGVSILPVDSEHSAIFQCIQGCQDLQELRRIILTASGGPFFGKKRAELENVTVEQALKHPNWDMGTKVTIDSATMMNKGLEVIEAAWLFDLPAEQIDVVVHRESIVHSLVEFTDYSVLAQLGVPDMKVPIQYAITHPNRAPSPSHPLNLAGCQNLSFYEPDLETFICLAACQKALKRGGLAPTAANGANEAAVALFLQHKIGFLEIGGLVMDAMLAQKTVSETITLEQILEADRAAREFVQDSVRHRA